MNILKPSEQKAIAECRLFAGVSPDTVQALLRGEPVLLQTAKKGENIYTATEFRRALGILIKGRVRVEKGDAGKSVIMSTLEKGGIFGMAALFYEESTYPTTLHALTDCVIAFVKKETLLHLFAREPRVTQNYISLISEKVHFLNRKIETLTKRADTKLYRFFREEYEKSGSEGKFVLRYSMADLSRVLGMGRTTLYREMNQLIAEHRIAKNGKTVTILDLEEFS